MTDKQLLEQALEALETLARYENPETKIQVRNPKNGGLIVTMYPHKVAMDALTAIRARLEQPEQEPVAIDGNTSDGYHTFNELYEFRKAYNAALFNEWAAGGKCSVHKSWRHHDGELCFGGGWFIVVAVLPEGQISNHYEAKDWDLFSVQETERALFEFDGHTGTDVIARLKAYTTPPAAPLQRCILCGYQHGHAIGCKNNPVDIALKKMAENERELGIQMQPPAAPVQEPVALQMDVIVGNLIREGINKHRARELAEHFIKHTTQPAAQRQWVGLTVEEALTEAARHLGEMHVENCGLGDIKDFAKAIEAKLKEKNA